VPANRYGYADPAEQTVAAETAPAGIAGWWNAKFSGPQLKIIQEVITIAVFIVFNAMYLKNTIRPTDWAAFALIIIAVAVMMVPRWLAENAEHKTSGIRPVLPEVTLVEPGEVNRPS
jgi:hypothetical protein